MSKPLNIAFETLGCKVNQYETEAIMEKFSDLKYEIVNSNSVEIDAVIINTCTVTNMADRKSRQIIRRAKKRNPNCIVAVIGCYAEIKPEEVSSIEEVDIVLGNTQKYNIVEVVEAYIYKEDPLKDSSKAVGFNTEEINLKPQEDKITKQTKFQEISLSKALESRSRAYVKIQDGCNRFCSYCIIPHVRGPIRSRSLKNIVAEVKGLLDNGYKEIVLTGINTALYGMEKYDITEVSQIEKLPLEDILCELEKLPEYFRIRFSSLEPTVVSHKQVIRLLKYKKLCNHFHLSLQSGSDRILKKMNRNYSREEYLSIVKTLREIDPKFGISADVIVGFPEEKDKDFQDSVDLVKESKLVKTHVFKYSKRDGTPAAKMKDQIKGSIMGERSDKLIELSEKVAKDFNEGLIGTRAEVLIEKYNENDNCYEGYTRNYVKAYITSNDLPIGQLVNIKVIDIYNDGVKGEIYE